MRLTSLLSPVSDHRLDALIAALRDDGHPVEFIAGPWQERLEALRTGDAAGGWLCGLLHVDLAAGGEWPLRAVAAPVSRRERAEGLGVYYGDVVVSLSSRVTEFSELAGARFAYNEVTSLSGYRMMLDLLALHGSDLTFFSTTIPSGSHVASLRLVAEGEADCAIIDSTLIDDGEEGTAGVRTLVSVGPYPAPPLVAAPGHEDILRQAAISSGWMAVEDETYSMLRD